MVAIVLHQNLLNYSGLLFSEVPLYIQFLFLHTYQDDLIKLNYPMVYFYFLALFLPFLNFYKKSDTLFLFFFKQHSMIRFHTLLILRKTSGSVFRNLFCWYSLIASAISSAVFKTIVPCLQMGSFSGAPAKKMKRRSSW